MLFIRMMTPMETVKSYFTFRILALSSLHLSLLQFLQSINTSPLLYRNLKQCGSVCPCMSVMHGPRKLRTSTTLLKYNASGFGVKLEDIAFKSPINIIYEYTMDLCLLTCLMVFQHPLLIGKQKFLKKIDPHLHVCDQQAKS